MRLTKNFFKKSPDIVARSLLGKILVRRVSGVELKSLIVETEAYFGAEDPASRACKNGDLKKTMEMESGTILVFGVHNNWLLNFVCGKKGRASAILIRAIEPINFSGRCSGPGLLTKCLGIKKEFHKKNLFNSSELWIEDSDKKFCIQKSFRVGVSKDLKRHLRFYIKGKARK